MLELARTLAEYGGLPRSWTVALYGLTAVSSGLVAFGASVQTLVEPAETWLPMTAIIALVGLAVAATAKVLRLFEDMRRAIARNRRLTDRIARELGIHIEEE